MGLARWTWWWTRVRRPSPATQYIVVNPLSLCLHNTHLATWNDASVKEAWDPNLPDAMKPATVYTASKVEVERGAYNWVAEFKPHFVLNTVLLNMNVRLVETIDLYLLSDIHDSLI
jgi:hypothetical protein